MSLVASCAAPPPSPTGTPTKSADAQATVQTEFSGTQLYDANRLGNQYPSLIEVPGLEKCKSAGQAFIRGQFAGHSSERCTNVRLESGWCDFGSISGKFEAVGNVTLSISGMPDLSEMKQKKPGEVFSALEKAGWLPDQCGTNEGLESKGGPRDPVVFLYRLKKQENGQLDATLQVLPICLSPPQGVTWTYKNKAICEI
jgi:hypothetical protein